MSTLQNEIIFESINEAWDIRPCFNGVGNWEVFDDTGSVHRLSTLIRKQKLLEKILYYNNGRIHYNDKYIHL
ncbi:MAG: hypothetical protein CM15mV11_3220 [Caudoviricetes sp.]|nr:MAG: hypothetical protein CM15mV11_3220 [Caudoviricetes sp.]